MSMQKKLEQHYHAGVIEGVCTMFCQVHTHYTKNNPTEVLNPSLVSIFASTMKFTDVNNAPINEVFRPIFALYVADYLDSLAKKAKEDLVPTGGSEPLKEGKIPKQGRNSKPSSKKPDVIPGAQSPKKENKSEE